MANSVIAKNEAKPILKAIAGSKDTPVKIGNAFLECYVLEDGTRVFSGRGLQKALEFPVNSSGNAMEQMLNSGELKSILTEEIIRKISDKKEFLRPGAGGSASKTYGYDVTLLIDICDLLIEGKNQGILTDRQKQYAIIAEIIIRSVAKVGIIALVDEATGYQYERELSFGKQRLNLTQKQLLSFLLIIFRHKLSGYSYQPSLLERGLDYEKDRR